MPRPVLQVVAGVLGAVWLGAFAFAAVTAQERGRLPGQRLDGVTGQPIQATEATPLTDERIQGAAQPTELSDEEKARLDEAKEAKEEAAAAARAEAAGVQPAAPAAAPAQPAAPSDTAPAAQPAAPPKPEEPPF
ncbi:MAG: hypothetical protein JF588_10435 [Caulobacterales bacterium]|nr:hypothetical protein [Caulobacterales bacterium]